MDPTNPNFGLLVVIMGLLESLSILPTQVASTMASMGSMAASELVSTITNLKAALGGTSTPPVTSNPTENPPHPPEIPFVIRERPKSSPNPNPDVGKGKGKEPIVS